jgi:HEPN domain-containing protein
MAATVQIWWNDTQEELAVARLLMSKGDPKKAYPRQAYHHAGQSAEFALKAILLRRRGLTELPDHLRTAKGHDLKIVAEAAGLGPDVARLQKDQNVCYLNWLTARDWDSNARFPGNRRSIQEINDLYTAVDHKPHGIMLWLETIFQKS